MTKDDIVTRVWNGLNLNKKQSTEVVETAIDLVKEVLSSGEKLKFGGFGAFEVKERKSRMGRNPKTGESAEIKAGKTIKFKAGKPLKTVVADSE